VVVFSGEHVSFPNTWYEGNAIGPSYYEYEPSAYTEHPAFMTMDLDLLAKPEARLIIEHTGNISSILVRDGGPHNWQAAVISPDVLFSTGGRTVFTGDSIFGGHIARCTCADIVCPIMYMNVEGDYTITKISVSYIDSNISNDSFVTGILMGDAGKVEYDLGGAIDLSGTTINLTLESGKVARNVPVTTDMIVGFSTAVVGERPITIVYPNTKTALSYTATYNISVLGAMSAAPQRPFPQAAVNNDLAAPLFKHSVLDQATMNQDIIDKFKSMIGNFLIDPNPDSVNDPMNFRMVLNHNASGICDAPPGGAQTTCSESMGYGMLALALMAGADEEVGIDIKAYFDGMFRSLRYWPAVDGVGCDYLMTWEIVNNTLWKTNYGNTSWRSASDNYDYSVSSATTATDGSLDMAYALVLASQQWTESNDGVNYLDYAKKMIDEIWRVEVRSAPGAGYWLNRGSWDTSSRYTRPSDHMMHHLKVFAALDPDNNWKGLIDNTYTGLLGIINRQNPPNGLLPDFVSISTSGVWSPSEPFSLESANDGDYHWNACRVPWRLGVDTMFHGTTPVTEFAVKQLNELQIEWSNGNFARISGRQLDGTVNMGVAGAAFSGSALIPAAIYGPQDWFDKGWYWARGRSWGNDFYGDYIVLLTMIAASGNEWSPIP
jgi:endo-1,4-beta-D-glucanase Y